ncbi:MAG TPA: hypothetical protein VFX92_08460 [Candidatus Krumholzibacteria bacterium]|nr:hypothetical protein [Candidatus Krumholzibacteria bacterium]
MNSGIVDPCNSTASAAAGVHFICPQGDGDPMPSTISITIQDNTTAPVAGIPAADFWLIGCNDLLVLCGGSGSINATGATDANGQTTITGDIAGGGCDTGVRVVCQGIVIGNGACPAVCLPIKVRSPDQRGGAGGTPDLLVSSADFSYFGANYPSPAKPFVECVDFVVSGTITLADFTKFGGHFNHKC